jgi:prevent-host-death family protein
MVNIYDAKTHLSQLVDRATAGEEVVISRNGRPVARLVRYEARGKSRKLGTLKGRVRIAPDFDAPLPREILDAFEGRR